MLLRSVRATPDECERGLDGDQIVAEPAAVMTRAVTVNAAPDDVWPWLARTAAPVTAGMICRGALGAPGPLEVIAGCPAQFLVLVRHIGQVAESTWSFAMTPIGDTATRLVVRTRTRHRVPLVRRWRQRRELRRLARRIEAHDALLDRFMPVYDARHHHAARVAAPASRTMAVALAQDLMQPRLVRTLIGIRAWALGAPAATRMPSRGLVADMEALGWAVLEDVPGHEIVMGAATRPWEPSPQFLPLPGRDFVMFHDPGFVKIAWSVRVEALGPDACVVHTETRAVATDAASRRRFALYWAVVSRGTALIRRALLASIRAAAT